MTTENIAPPVGTDTRDPEEGLRDLTARDWVVASGFGVLLAAALFLMGSTFIPTEVRPPVVLLGFGMGLLGYLDHCTRLIRNRHNLIFGAATLATFGVTALVYGSFPWLTALIGAVVVFAFMLILTLLTGFAGGGDIKLSPIPGAVLATVNPLAACLWLLATFTLCLIPMIVAKIRRSTDPKSAMGPYMAIALIPALLASGAIMSQMGL